MSEICKMIDDDSSSSSSSPLPPPPEQLCCVHCNFCGTILAVGVPLTSLFKIVTVKCGHCNHLLSVNMSAATFGTELSQSQKQCAEVPRFSATSDEHLSKSFLMEDATKLLPTIRTDAPPEKRPRLPSVYNRFIKAEIQRIKANNPEIKHKEAFSAAAKNWAHYPHIKFGMMLEKNRQCVTVADKENSDVVVNDGKKQPNFW
eukprot:TRINITY_DN5587_c0_g1_i1.p1 TRINITY_DN5587_c0_g1~~TRINITY_DN5587_c0_g1_i1.p1  ORF type:complete len:202 (-),score=31.24 TRINITY_DN5587_c0_g1_i1:251-856(-)